MHCASLSRITPTFEAWTCNFSAQSSNLCSTPSRMMSAMLSSLSASP